MQKISYMKKTDVWLLLVPIILFILLSVCIAAGVTHGFENWAYNEAVENMTPVMTQAMKFLTHLGDPYFVTGFCLLLIAIPKTRRTAALPVSAAVILSFALNLILKAAFSRERPDVLRLISETSYSFPSGHAMTNSSLYTMLSLLILKFIKDLPKRIALIILCAALAVIIGFTRLYLGVHYAGDIIGGWMIGFAVSMLVYYLWKRICVQERPSG